jgi:hypothetical protein
MDIVLLKGMQEALLITINEMVEDLENREGRLGKNGKRQLPHKDQALLDKVIKLRRFYISQNSLIDTILTRGVDR